LADEQHAVAEQDAIEQAASESEIVAKLRNELLEEKAKNRKSKRDSSK